MIRTKNIQVRKGKSVSLSFVIKDKNDEIIDLTSLTGKIKVHLNIPGQDNAPVIDKALTITSAVKGEVSVLLVDSETSIDAALYQYVLEFVYGAGDNRVLAYGLFELVGDDVKRINQIKEKYGLTYDNLAMTAAFNWAHRQMLSNAFVDRCEVFTATKDRFDIKNHVADKNFDDVVDASDIEIIEYQRNEPFGLNDLSGNVTNVTFDHPNGNTMIFMDAKYPSASGYAVQVKYKQIAKKFSDAIENIKRVEEMYTIYHLFDILEPFKLQQGLPDRSINGVTIRFDQQGVADYKLKLWKDILNETMKFQPFYSRSIEVDKGYLSRNPSPAGRS